MVASRAAKWSWVIFGAIIVVYGRSVEHDFHYDDFHSIVHNPHIRSLKNLPAIFVDPTRFSANPQSAMFRPLLLASYVANYSLDGLSPRGYHLLNVFLHGLNAVLVLRLLLLLGQGWRIALGAALVFAFTPLNSEAVNYVSSRSVLLLAVFFLGSCIAYVRFSLAGKRWWYAAALTLAGAAILVKSVGVVVVAGFIVCDLALGGWGRVRQRWGWYLGPILVAAIYSIAIQSLIKAALLRPVRTLDIQLWTQLKAQIYYGILAVMPVRLSVEHQFFLARHPGQWAVVLPGVLLASLVGLGVGCRRRTRVWIWGGWWVALVLPTTVVPLIVLVNEHRLYLPSLAFCWALAWALNQWWAQKGGVAIAGIGAYTIILALLAFARTGDWLDEVSLWRSAAASGPQMFKPHLRLADALAAKEDFAAAEGFYKQALALRPHHPGARNNLGNLYMRQMRYTDAQAEFVQALHWDAAYVPAHLNLAELHLRRKDWQKAADQYRNVLALAPRSGAALQKMGFIALHYSKEPALAVDYFTQALEYTPAKAVILAQRGVAFKALGRLAAAEDDYQKSLFLDGDQVETWYNLGNLYQMQKRRAEAVDAFERVLELNGALKAEARARLQQLTPQAP